jgi:peptide deformylase
MNVVMYNPVIVKKDTPYETEEGCLSLTGVRKTTRYQNIEVEYQDASWKKHWKAYSGWIAQIIQHECDHLAASSMHARRMDRASFTDLLLSSFYTIMRRPL